MTSSDTELQNLPWVEKYRPQSLNEIVAHQDIVNTIDKLIETNKLPHMIFSGPAGVGKTSTILACAKKIYGKDAKNMVLELNGSDNRGIDVIRNQIKDFVAAKTLFSQGIKLVILDEADSMTYDAQFALRRLIENYTYNTRFCLICNYSNKIITALQSRCMVFRFGPISEEQIREQLIRVVEIEQIEYTDDGIEAVIKLSRGDMRRVYNLLQAVQMSFNLVNEENVFSCVGNPLPKDIQIIYDILEGDSSMKESFNQIYDLQKEKGLALVDILRDISEKSIEERDDEFLMMALPIMADIENRLSQSTSDIIQLGALTGIFKS